MSGKVAWGGRTGDTGEELGTVGIVVCGGIGVEVSGKVALGGRIGDTGEEFGTVGIVVCGGIGVEVSGISGVETLPARSVFSGEDDMKGVFELIGFVELACSKAVANACIVTNRSFGSLASAIKTTCSTSEGIVGTFSRIGGGGTRVCLAAISVNDP